MDRQIFPQPGKLGSPQATLENDPRLDPLLAPAMAMPGGVALGVEPPEVGAGYEACLAFCSAFEEADAAMHHEMQAAMPPFPQVTQSTEVVSGIDGNRIELYIRRPTEQNSPLPCIFHIHGGGMAVMSAKDPAYVRWCNSLVNAGLVVIAVEFRNGGGRLGNHPFPAGLNDCASALQWVSGNREHLRVASIVVSGESGGGNLTVATALKANREGWVDQIAGVYALCPYLTGGYTNPPMALRSLVENDGYLLDSSMSNALATVYDPGGDHAKNPLAWPLWAQDEDLRGLPPHVISVNELDPLRDEGLAYYRRLLGAGVLAIGRTVHGTPHAGDVRFPDVVPLVYDETIRSISGFAQAL